MARRRPDLQIALTEGDGVVGDEKAVGSRCTAGGRESDPATGSLLQHPGAGDVVGMDMGFERIGEAQSKLLDQRRVAAHLLEYRIDDHGCTAAPVGEQIGVGGGRRIEQLPEDQHDEPR